MEPQEKIKVLVVDDDRTIRDFLTHLLTFQGLEARSADDGDRALELAQKEKFDLIFLDIRMPRMNGLETFSRLKKLDPELSCVFMTGYALEEALLDKTKQPGVICLRKPFDDIAQITEIANRVLKEGRSSAKTGDAKRDRRAYLRLSVALEVDYKIKQDQEESFTSGLTKDVAIGGIRLIVPQDIAPGTILELAMKAKGDAKPCNAVAEVVWNKESQDKAGYYEIGLRFTKIDYEEFTAMFIRSGEITPSITM